MDSGELHNPAFTRGNTPKLFTVHLFRAISVMQSIGPAGSLCVFGSILEAANGSSVIYLATEEAAFSYLGSTSQMNRPYLARLLGDWFFFYTPQSFHYRGPM